MIVLLRMKNDVSYRRWGKWIFFARFSSCVGGSDSSNNHQLGHSTPRDSDDLLAHMGNYEAIQLRNRYTSFGIEGRYRSASGGQMFVSFQDQSQTPFDTWRHDLWNSEDEASKFDSSQLY